MKNTLKKSVYVLSALALCITANTFAAETAAESMHYATGALTKSRDFPAITVVNTTYGYDGVYEQFTDGSAACMAIYPSGQPDSTIIADNPDQSWAKIQIFPFQDCSGDTIQSWSNVPPGSTEYITQNGTSDKRE